MEALEQSQIDFYREHGYLVLPAYLSPETVSEARTEIGKLSAPARGMTKSNDLIDLEDSHTPESPRIRRIKRPDLQSDFFMTLLKSDAILGLARDLLGPSVRLQTAKINMKKAEYGAPVHWHQDWAFYPYTNDDVMAIGIVFDDMDDENGPLQVIPGSHKGPILDHHTDGVFTGAANLEEAGLTLDDAVSMKGPAGTVSVHHARTLHGSALNRSSRDRQMLFYELMAADAFPVMGAMTDLVSLEEFDKRLLCGTPTKEPRMTSVPIRVPMPLPEKAGSIYEVQSQGRAKQYQSFEEATAV